MNQIEHYISDLGNKILLKQKEIGFEKDSNRRLRLRKELNVLQLRKDIAVIRKKIKQLEGE